MTTKVKGLFRGLKKLNIFDEKEDEDEMQIGFPTDVKHVAHIGPDGPSASTPTWMADIKSASEAPELSPKPAAVNFTETHQGNGIKGDGIRNMKEIPRSKPHSKDTHANSPTKRSSDGSKPTRHHRSSDPTSDSSTRQTRRHRSANQGGESLSEEIANTAPKQHRRRKSKTTIGDGSVRSSRRSSKGHSMTEISFSDLESGHGSNRCDSPILE